MTVKSSQSPPVQVIVPVPDAVSIIAFSLPPGGTTPVVVPPDELDQLPIVDISQVPVPPTQYTLARVSTKEIETAAKATLALSVDALAVVVPADASNSSTTNKPFENIDDDEFPLDVVPAGVVNVTVAPEAVP